MALFSGGIFNRPGPSSLPRMGESLARTQAMQAQAGMLEQQRQAAWYQAHPDRAVHILGHEGAAAIGIESLEYKQQKLQMEADAQAKEWEAEYTAKDKQRIAGIQNGVAQARASGNFSESQMQQIEQMGSMQIMGISPSLLPKSKNSKLMDALAEQGRSPGTPWKGDDGGIYSTEFDDAGRPKIRLLVRPDQSIEAIQAKLQAAREKDLAEARMKLEELTTTHPVSKVEKSKYSPSVVESKLKRMYKWYHEQQIALKQEEMAAAANVRAEKRSAKMHDVDMDLPPEVAEAQSYMREIMDEYGDGGKDVMATLSKIPEGKKAAAIEAYNVLMQAQNQLGQ